MSFSASSSHRRAAARQRTREAHAAQPEHCPEGARSGVRSPGQGDQSFIDEHHAELAALLDSVKDVGKATSALCRRRWADRGGMRAGAQPLTYPPYLMCPARAPIAAGRKEQPVNDRDRYGGGPAHTVVEGFFFFALLRQVSTSACTRVLSRSARPTRNSVSFSAAHSRGPRVLD